MAEQPHKQGWSWWYLLLILVCLVSLFVPLYNKLDPTWIGLPFFYWFQLVLVVVSAAAIAIVYFATDK